MQRLAEDKVETVVLGSGMWRAKEDDYINNTLSKQVHKLRSHPSLQHLVLVGYPRQLYGERNTYFRRMMNEGPRIRGDDGKKIKLSLIDMHQMVHAPWPDDEIDWRHLQTDGQPTKRQFMTTVHHTDEDKLVGDHHYQCGIEPLLAPRITPAEHLRTPPNHDCSDMLNLNVVQLVLRLVMASHAENHSL